MLIKKSFDNMQIKAASDKNGPYGITCSFFKKSLGMPNNNPRKGAKKNVATPSFHPKKPPITPMSFTSPKPIASFLKTILPITPHKKINPAAMKIPIKDAQKEFIH